MKTIALPVLFIVSAVVAAGAATSFVLEPAEAARASRPKEIVVVGSKVKEVIREAGLRSDGDLVQAVNEAVSGMIRRAFRRAVANGRKTVRPHDFSCLPDSMNPDWIVRDKDTPRELMQVISDKVYELLEDAIRRCTSNGRSTVRPHDL
jgi:histone H3/H4